MFVGIEEPEEDIDKGAPARSEDELLLALGSAQPNNRADEMLVLAPDVLQARLLHRADTNGRAQHVDFALFLLIANNVPGFGLNHPAMIVGNADGNIPSPLAVQRQVKEVPRGLVVLALGVLALADVFLGMGVLALRLRPRLDRKSTRLNSSHL